MHRLRRTDLPHVTSTDRFDEGVVFKDSMDKLIVAWVGADAGVASWLAGLAGYPHDQFKQAVEQLEPNSVTTVLETRWPPVATAQ